MTNVRPTRNNDWTDGQVEITRLRNVSYGMTAYAVEFEGTFIGYAVGRDGGWSQQEEEDRTIPVAQSYTFVFGGPSRNNAIDNLLFQARIAHIIPPKVAATDA